MATITTITICYFVIAINIFNIDAQCNSDCTLCADRAACVGSALECAYSTDSGCIPSDETPFIFILEATGGFNWYEAEVRCQTLHNSHLASVRSEQEDEWALSLCENGERTACWIGGYWYFHDSPTEFMWLDGADFTYGASPYSQPLWQISKPKFDGCNMSPSLCALKVTTTGWTDLPNAGSPVSQTEAGLCRRDCICPDDDNPCTEEICVEGECVHNPLSDTTACNTDCIPNGKCFQGACIGEIECDNAECDGLCCNDENPCMENTVCSELICSGAPVADGETCTIGCIVGLCNNGQCLDGVVDCSLGCDDTPCDDGNDLTIDDVCSENVCAGNPIPSPTANPTLDPTESSDSSSDSSSEEQGDDVTYAMSVQDNNQLLERNIDGNDNTYNLRVEFNNETWTCVWIILGTFVVCNGVFIWYWCRTKSTNAQKKSLTIL